MADLGLVRSAGNEGRLSAERPFFVRDPFFALPAWHATRLELYWWLGKQGPIAATMKARQLIEGASFDPTQLKVITKAFDGAWEQIAPTVSPDPRAVEANRFKLANVVLSLAKDGTQDAKRLTAEALKIMLASPTGL
jgi:hypothetical protein